MQENSHQKVSLPHLMPGLLSSVMVQAWSINKSSVFTFKGDAELYWNCMLRISAI